MLICVKCLISFLHITENLSHYPFSPASVVTEPWLWIDTISSRKRTTFPRLPCSNVGATWPSSGQQDVSQRKIFHFYITIWKLRGMLTLSPVLWTKMQTWGWWALSDNVNKGILGTAKQQASSRIQWSHIQELHEREITFYLVYAILVLGLYYGSKSILTYYPPLHDELYESRNHASLG